LFIRAYCAAFGGAKALLTIWLVNFWQNFVSGKRVIISQTLNVIQTIKHKRNQL
jgi:hypothetical protein